jgi:hypothetical protein
VVITQEIRLAEAPHGAGDHRALEKLVVERNGLRGIARELCVLVASPAGES